MTDRLEEIRQRAEAATPGPWIGASTPSGRKYGVVAHADGPLAVLSGIRAKQRHPDTQFIAHAREDIPYLLAEVERLREGIADFAPKCYCSGPRAYTASWAEECPNIEDCAYIATLLDRPNYAAEGGES